MPNRKVLVALFVAFSISAGRLGRGVAAFAFLYVLMEGRPKHRIVSVLPAAAALLSLCSSFLSSVPAGNVVFLLLFLSYALLTPLPFGFRSRKGWLFAHLLLCLGLCALYLFRIWLTAPGMVHITVAQLAQYDRIERIAGWVNFARCLLNLGMLLPLLKRQANA